MQGSLPTELSRSWACACGADFRQQGWELDGHAIWWPHSCPNCFTTESAAEARELADQERVLTQRRVLLSVGVPNKYHTATLETFQVSNAGQARARDWAQQYLATWPNVPLFVIFQGAYQTGKTHIAWAIIRSLAFRGVRGRLVTVADLVRELRESWRSKEGPSEAQRLHLYRRHDLLVLDELSTHGLSAKHISPHLYDIIAHRINNERPTIVTTNEKDRSLVDLLGGALQQRLELEGGVVEFGVTSYRRDHARS